MATTTSKMRAKGRAWSFDGRQFAVPFILALALSVFAWAAKADTWTGAGQAYYGSYRDWGFPENWLSSVVPPANDQNFFTQLGDGMIRLNGPQSAGAMIFADFAYPTIDPGSAPGTSNLTMVNSPDGSSYFQMGESVRDTYGVNYFTAGPLFTTDVILTAPFDIHLGSTTGSSSAMMISGNIISSVANNSITYTGSSTGSSLWITSANDYSSTGMAVKILDNSGAVADSKGQILHLADAGRLDSAQIELNGFTCELGLQDTTSNMNSYFSQVICDNGGTIFADRSYQLDDLDSSINVIQTLESLLVKGINSVVHFGSPSTYGRTNNGFATWVQTMTFEEGDSVGAMVYNGNLTEDRAGSRYVSGANRLQEAHNHAIAQDLYVPQNTPFVKGGPGIFWALSVNDGGLWPVAPQISEGVLRLGNLSGPWHSLPASESLQLLTPDAALGITWNTQILLSSSGSEVPFPIKPSGTTPGQCGAVDLDTGKFGYTVTALPTIDTNIPVDVGKWTYLRIGSSMGDDASFDPQFQLSKHGGIVFKNKDGVQTQIVPFINPGGHPIYYFGGGGGTLKIETQLNDFEGPTDLEMGTTGILLPGRVILNPGGDTAVPNLYTGSTYIRAGTLQLMNKDAVQGTDVVRLGTYDQNITQGLYKNPAYPAQWEGPGQLLLDPNSEDWNLEWYTAGGGTLLGALRLDGGAIGWTSDVKIIDVPGQYGATLWSDLKGVPQQVNVLGLGGEYSAGAMKTEFNINDTPEKTPVILYKVGKNSVLDLTQTPIQTADPNDPLALNTYTGGTIIAGGTVEIDDSRQLNAAPGGTGGPITILNGGRLKILSGLRAYFYVPIKIMTDGTPDTVKNCGSVIEVGDIANPYTILCKPLDFSSNPGAYLEKDGPSLLQYAPVVAPEFNDANAWGVKLTQGQMNTNQMPVNVGQGNTGPIIFNNGYLAVHQVPAAYDVPDTDPGYGFRSIISLKNTSSSIFMLENALFRTHGYEPNEILGTVYFSGGFGECFVHFSRNMAPTPLKLPAAMSRGNGMLSFKGVIVYMSSESAPPNPGVLNVLPRDAGFTLELVDGVIFHASQQNEVYGTVSFKNLDVNSPVQINGAEADPIPISTSPYIYNLTPQTWPIRGTGRTSWRGEIWKIGTGTVQFDRQQGTPVMVDPSTLLKIIDGTIIASGTADPFTDNVSSPGFSLDIQNDSTAMGLLISEGIKTVDQLTGVGNTTVSGPADTELIATYIAQNTLTIGAGCKVTIKPLPSGPLTDANFSAVPEPSAWILITAIGVGLLVWRLRIALPKKQNIRIGN
jgi:hypothetical protein